MKTLALPLLLAIAVSACGDRKETAPAKTSDAGPFVVRAAPSPDASASSGGTSNSGDRLVALPDFTPLMKSEGPAVVNVITTNKAAANLKKQLDPQVQSGKVTQGQEDKVLQAAPKMADELWNHGLQRAAKPNPFGDTP